MKLLLAARKGDKDREPRISELSPEDKFKLLENNMLPNYGPYAIYNSNKKLKYRFRKEIVNNLDACQDIHYSKSTNQVYCLSCAMFERKTKLQYQQTRWTKGNGNFKTFGDKCSEKSLYKHIHDGDIRNHTTNHLHMINFVKSMRGETSTLDQKLNQTKTDEIDNTKLFLLSVIDTISYLGSQGLALRGHREGFDSDNPYLNRGNFLEGLNFISKYSPEVKKRLEKIESSKSHMKGIYTSPAIQNEIIDLIASEIIKSIIEEVKEAGMYTFILDEVTSFNKQYLTICLRYLNPKNRPTEQFLTYVELDSGNAETIFAHLFEQLEKHGLSLGKE